MAEKKKGFLTEFKEFITKGNVFDMAVGVVVGAAFKAIVTSLVDNIINPIIGLVLNTSSLEEAKLVMKEAIIDKETQEIIEEAVTLNYGSFVKSIIDFLIVALCLFCAIKVVMKLKSAAEAAAEKLRMEKKAEEEAAEAVAEAAKPSADEESAAALKEILEILKKQNNNQQ